MTQGDSTARLLVPAIATLVMSVILIGLGVWQLERKGWKENVIGMLQERLAAPATALPPSATWPQVTPEQDEFRRVSFSARFLSGKDALVYAAASAMRDDVAGIGYWVFTPARLADGRLVVVNRGFVPQDRKDKLPPVDENADVQITGILRWPEPHTMFAPKDDPQRNLWFARDQRTIADTKGWPAVAPFFVEMEQPTPAGGWPKPGRLKLNLPNNHLSYALTWFALAGVLLIVFGSWVWSSRRERRLFESDQTSL